ncbi:MAG TPA: hypothetical protein DCW29_05970 [Janthinobacterium sp.]|nr:hypothetical protein [Janthinobacterium sp.]
MKSPFAYAVAALLITTGLAACGGKATYPVSGTILGLNNAGMILSNNSDTVAPAAGATSFTFPTQVSYGENYNIAVQTQPAHMTCVVTSGGSGTGGQYLSINAVVGCSQTTHALGGTITGLTVAGLVLGNGSDNTNTPVAGATTFTMPTPVADGAFYGLTVQTQPPGLKCTIANGSGTMGTADIATVAVSCNPG